MFRIEDLLKIELTLKKNMYFFPYEEYDMELVSYSVPDEGAYAQFSLPNSDFLVATLGVDEAGLPVVFVRKNFDDYVSLPIVDPLEEITLLKETYMSKATGASQEYYHNKADTVGECLDILMGYLCFVEGGSL